MKYPKILFVIFSFSLFLAACSPSNKPVSSPRNEPIGNSLSTPQTNTTSTPKANAENAPGNILQPAISPTQTEESQQPSTQSDTQGAVIVEMKPINLDKPGESLNFEISMDTHSVDLSMDLTKLAVLTTDTGKTFKPVSWDGPRGGHHVKGTLSFPASLNGEKIVKSGGNITITIKDVDVPLRTFTWQIQG